jgi:hypothetical protein
LELPTPLRISCEGQLEVLEEAAARLQGLSVALAGSEWHVALAGFDLPALEGRAAAAREVLMTKLRQDEGGEAQRALEAFAAARQALKESVRVRCARLGLPGTGKLGPLVEQLRAELPVCFEAAVVLPVPAKPMAKRTWLTLLLILWWLLTGASLRHAGLLSEVAFEYWAAAGVLCIFLSRFWLKKPAFQASGLVTVTSRAVVFNGKRFSLEAEPVVHFTGGFAGLTRVTVGTRARPMFEFLLRDAPALRRVLRSKGIKVFGLPMLPMFPPLGGPEA